MTRILLVETDENSRDMLSRRLGRRGYEVLLAADGPEGLAQARAGAPDLILMDLGLPLREGWGVVGELKADPATRAIPVIALTAYAMGGDRQLALRAGCADYDTKPVDLPGLLTRIATLLARTRPGGI